MVEKKTKSILGSTDAAQSKRQFKNEKQMQIIGDAESNHHSALSRSILEPGSKADIKGNEQRKSFK